jgi:hypothetical protein
MRGVSDLIGDPPSDKLFRFKRRSAARRFVMGAF